MSDSSNDSQDSGHPSPETLDLAIPPWILIHDDGSRLTFFDTFSTPTTPFVVADRSSCFDAIEFLTTETCDADRIENLLSVVDRLQSAGVLVPASNLEIARQADYGNEMPFGHFDFEVDAAIDDDLFDDRARTWAAHLGGLGRRPQSITVHFVGAERLAPPGRWAKLASLADRFARCISPGWDRESQPNVSIDFNAVVPLAAIDDAALTFAERYARATVRVRLDTADLPLAEGPSRWVARTGEIAALGFDLEVDLHTQFEIELKPLCRDLIQRGHCTAIALKPTFPTTDRSRLEAWLEHALLETTTLPNELGSVLHRSEPWKSILRAAVVPMHLSLGWNRKQAIVHLASDGRWSRSRYHASTEASLELADLFPAKGTKSASAWQSNRIRPTPSIDGSPDCENCEFLAICPRYWTPEFDASRRRSEADRSAAIAIYECQTRKSALGSLVLNLLSMNSTFDLVRTNTTLRAEFDNATKQVRIRQ